MRHKYSQVILQTLSGPVQKDYEYDKKLQEFKEVRNRMATIKKVIDNFPRKMDGYKQMLDTIVGTCEFIFDKNQKSYYQFMHNITSAHKALADKLVGLFNHFGQLTNSTNIWIKEINEVVQKVKLRQQCRKNYEHYEKKLYELNTDRMKEIKKKNKISESDHERFIRNVGKFQKAGKEYIYSSNSSYRAMENFLNIRYDRIVSAMVELIEAERNFYNEASHIMNFFSNIRNNTMGLKKTLIVSNAKYDASNFTKGVVILNMSAEEIFSSNYRAPQPQTGYNPGPAPGPYGPGQSYNTNINNNNNNKGIINPFSADSDNFENNTNINNNFGSVKTFPNNNNNFNIQSTRDTFALNNPYNTQANPYAANNNTNNNFGGNNNFNNPYNNMQNDANTYGGNNDDDPFNDNDPYGGNNDQNQYYGNNNIQNPYGNDNQDDFNGPKDNYNNMNNENTGNNNNNQNNNNDNNNGDEDPFDF